MRDTFVHPLRPTTGERRLLAAAMGVGTCGGLVTFVIVTQMGQNKEMLRSLTEADLWFVTAGILGALYGLYLGRNWMGHVGLRGNLKALGGILIISFGGALVGGTLALPFYGTMFGPLMFGLTLIGNPVMAILWLNTLVMSHFLMRIWRRERDARRISQPVVFAAPRLARRRDKPAVRNWLTPSLDRARR